MPERLEYCFGIIPVTPIVEPTVASTLAAYVEREITRDDLTEHDQVLAVETLYNYLLRQLQYRRSHSPFIPTDMTGAEYFLERILDALNVFWNYPLTPTTSAALLDF